MKDCTFKPQINQKKKDPFHGKRKSNSVIAIARTRDDDNNIDAYYKKLDEAYPQASLINNAEKPENSSKKVAENKDEDVKPISRHDLLYNSKQVYNQRKEIIKEEVLKERTKNYTFKPQLYKSKVNPNKNLNYQVYQRRPKAP